MRRRFCSVVMSPASRPPFASCHDAAIARRRRLMDMVCSRCGTIATPAGHEDGRAFYRCEFCNRVWMTDLTAATNGRVEGPTTTTRVLVVDDSDQLVDLVAA